MVRKWGQLPTFVDGMVSSADLLELSPAATGFLGVSLELDGQTHYGWLGLEVDPQLGFVLRDAAFQSIAGQSLTTGVVPEPTVGWGICVLVGAIRRRWWTRNAVGRSSLVVAA